MTAMLTFHSVTDTIRP